MKRILFTLTFISISCIASIIVSACSSPNEVVDNSKPFTTEDMLWLTVIKFTEQSYKDYILASDRAMYKKGDDTCFYAYGALFHGDMLWMLERAEKTDLLSHFPYIELTDGYLLVDWRWQPVFYYLCDRVNGNYGHTILTQKKWTELQDLTQIWDRNTPNDHEALYRVHNFRVKAIEEEYRGNADYAMGYENHLYRIQGRNDALTSNTIHSIDSLQNIYVDCILKILNDYKFEEEDSFIRHIK